MIVVVEGCKWRENNRKYFEVFFSIVRDFSSFNLFVMGDKNEEVYRAKQLKLRLKKFLREKRSFQNETI